MAKKPAQRPAPPPQPPPQTRRRTPLIAVIIAAAAVAVGAFAFSRTGGSDSRQNAADPSAQPPAQTLAPLEGPPPNAKFGPHKQAVLPALPFSGFPPARPVEVVTAAYKFAAEHPEVLGYVPCYCGCERSGHRGNDDCFVAARTPSGDVADWEPHGMT